MRWTGFLPWRGLLPALLALLLALVLAGQALAQGSVGFRLRNASGQVVEEIYVSAPGSNAWAADLLGTEVLRIGASLEVRAAQCVVDIRIVFASGRSETRRAVNICEQRELALAPPATEDPRDVAGRGAASRSLSPARPQAPGSAMATAPAPVMRDMPAPAAPPVVVVPPAPPGAAPMPPRPGATPMIPPGAAQSAMPVARVQPVYNLVLDGLGGPAAQVERRRTTQARFFVGPPDAASRLLDANSRQAQPVARFDASQDTSLKVTFECSWCAGEPVQVGSVMWRAAAGRSDEAVFSFTPRPDAQPEPGVPLALHVYLSGLGESFRHLVVPVTLVDRVVPGVPVAAAQPIQGGGAAPGGMAEATEDVQLRIISQTTGFLLQAAFSPRFLAGANEADRALLVAAQAAQFYRMGISNADRLKEKAGQLYRRLRSLATGDASDPDAPVVNHATPFLNAADFGAVVGSLCDLGNDLYALLFRDDEADPALRGLLPAIERTAATGGYSLQVQARGLYLPWQLLHPNCGQANAQDGFWGMRFAVSSQPMERERPAGALGASPTGPSAPLLFGRYSDASDTGPDAQQVLAGATQMNDAITRVMGAAPQVARTRPAFLRQVEEQRADYRLIWTYTHADSGVLERASQRLIFGTNNAVRPDDLNRIWRNVTNTAPEAVVLPRRPLVVLLGCETGASHLNPFSGESLAGMFLKLGAVGVVVTESKVWAPATVEFGTRLAERLQAGAQVPAALRELRAEWMQRGNPYGLLFTFYGHPQARLN